MRILIATDAWRPQVNGVVSTLERMTQAAAELGASFEFLTPQGMWSAPLPSVPGNSLRDPILAEDRPAHRGSQARPYPHRHGRPDRLADPALLPHPQADLHHQLSHPLPRICVGADARSRMADLCGLALFSRAFSRRDGADADDRRRPHPPRLPPGPALDARRQPRGLPAALKARARPAGSDLPVGWTGGGGKEPRGAARASICLAPPSSSATGRFAASSSAATAMRIFSAPNRAKSWPTSMRARTCSSSPRAPTRSGSS